MSLVLVTLRRPHSFSEASKEKSPTVEQSDTLRRPRSAVFEDVIPKGKTMPDKNDQKHGKNVYTIEYLARLALSPLCLGTPNEWERISTDYPTLVRKVSVFFINILVS